MYLQVSRQTQQQQIVDFKEWCRFVATAATNTVIIYITMIRIMQHDSKNSYIDTSMSEMFMSKIGLVADKRGG